MHGAACPACRVLLLGGIWDGNTVVTHQATQRHIQETLKLWLGEVLLEPKFCFGGVGMRACIR